MLAEALDAIDAKEFDVKRAAAALGCSTSQLVRFVAAIPEALGRYLATHPPADQRIEAIRRELEARPGSWSGRRRYVGCANLAERRTLAEDPRADEWITRGEPPTTPAGR